MSASASSRTARSRSAARQRSSVSSCLPTSPNGRSWSSRAGQNWIEVLFMLKPVGLTHGHYECRSLDETLPVFTDLLAMQVLERGKGQAVVCHPNTSWRLVVHEGGPDAPDKPHNNHYGVRLVGRVRPALVHHQ